MPEPCWTAVIFAVPFATDLTSPFWSTFATESRSLLQVRRSASVALAGEPVTESCAVWSASRKTEAVFIVMLWYGLSTTCTVHWPARPLCVFAEICTSPSPWGVTFPFWSTVAMLLSELSQVSSEKSAFSGLTVAVSFSDSPFT